MFCFVPKWGGQEQQSLTPAGNPEATKRLRNFNLNYWLTQPDRRVSICLKNVSALACVVRRSCFISLYLSFACFLSDASVTSVWRRTELVAKAYLTVLQPNGLPPWNRFLVHLATVRPVDAMRRVSDRPCFPFTSGGIRYTGAGTQEQTMQEGNLQEHSEAGTGQQHTLGSKRETNTLFCIPLVLSFVTATTRQAALISHIGLGFFPSPS